MAPHQAKQYFFNRIRIQILKAQAGRKLCQDMHLVERLARFERERRGNDRIRLRLQPVDATHALNLSAGVSNSNVSRGRSFN